MKKLEPINNVLVLGGGTAGWMTAAYLSKAFGHQVSISVLEAPSIPRVGVGEATVPNLQKSFFDFLGIAEFEWMPHCNAAFKTAVKFINWRKKAPGEASNHFYHPFGILPSIEGIPLPQYWFYRTRGKGEGVDYACFREPPLMDANLSPKMRDGRRAVPHAWHFDAHLVADYLAKWAIKRGVIHIKDEVQDVRLDDMGQIASLQCRSGINVKADFYVDCSGSRGVLINKALGEPFIDMSDYLFCDSAVAAAIPNDDAKTGVEPYTSSIAMSSGWTWKIPMLTRFGSGYVYSSNFSSEDQAARDYCALWKLDESKVNLNRIKFRTGRNARAWVKNCVSIGLSSCFVEPLESTGIYFITAAIYQFAKHFPANGCTEELANNFNREIEYMFDDSRDFLQAHYFTTTRDDSPFWLACKNELRLSDSMKEKIALYKAGLPINAPSSNEDDYYSSLDVEFRNFWTNGSYYAIFSGMGFYPDHAYPALLYNKKAILRADEVFSDIKKRQAALTTELPTNFEFLSTLHHGHNSAELSPALALSNPVI